MYCNNLSDIEFDHMSQNAKEQAIRSSWFTMEELESILPKFDLFLSEVTPDVVSTVFGPNHSRLLHKTNIFSEANMSASLNHTRAIIVHALKVTSLGMRVTLIEAMSSNYVQMVRDVDLCWLDDEGILVFADLTSDLKLADSKLSKLSSENYVKEYKTLVVKHSSRFPYVPMRCPEIRSKTFESEMELSEFLVNKFQSMSNNEIMECLDIVSNSLEPSEGKSGPKAKGWFKSNKSDLLRCSKENGLMISLIMTTITDGLPETIKEYYTIPHWAEQTPVKRMFRTAPSNVAVSTMDPWERAGLINNFWCKMIHTAKKGDLVSSEHFINDDGYVPDVSIKRVSLGDQLVDAFVLEARGRRIVDLFQDRSPSQPPLNWSEQESVFDDVVSNLMSKGSSSVLSDVFLSLCNDSRDGTRVGEVIPKLCAHIDQTWSGSLLYNLFEHLQSLSRAVGVARKLNLKTKIKKGSIMKSKCYFNLVSVGNHLNVGILNNIHYKNKSGLSSVVMFGSHGYHPYIVSPNLNDQSELFSVTDPILSWWSTAILKFYSYLSLTHETIWASRSKVEIKSGLDPKTLVMQGLLFLTNSSKFSQYSEQIRYLTLNSTGMGNHTKALWDKVSWYQPKNLVEHLFSNRLHKMIFIAEIFKSNNCKDLLSVMMSNTIQEPSIHKKIQSISWSLCFPHDHKYLPDESYMFNSFYICKLLTVERNNKMLSESQVVMKQLEAREEFLAKYHPSPIVDIHSGLALSGEKFRPNVYVQALGAAYSVIRIYGSMQQCFRLHDASWKIMNTKVHSVLNNRGSVLYSGPSGLSVTKDKKTHQNSKCYATVLHEMEVAFDDDRSQHEHTDGSYPAPKTRIPTHLNNQLWHALFNILNRNLNVVAKMVHKDQIGVREIAVLNGPGRIVCFFIEELARSIRSEEHRMGDLVNLIEHPKKDEIVNQLFNESLMSDDVAIYDNADCSTWGPSMMPYSLYLCLAMRFNDVFVRRLLRSSLSLFSNKVFKLPDVFYETMLSRKLTGINKITEAVHRVYELNGTALDLSKQIIHSPEGMFQGILGCSSSVLASDCLRMSEHITLKTLPVSKMVSVATSDDYCRILYMKPGDKIHKLSMASVSLHVAVSDRYGIKRNMAKSSMTSTVMEFNSTYRTRSGIYKPDVKSRTAYVDYSHDFDMYASALTALTMSVQYARQEGSLLGATMIKLLRTLANLQQNQLVSTYLEDPDRIYNVPLEYGGQVRSHILKYSGFPSIMALMENYGGSKEIALSNFIRMTSFGNDWVSTGDGKAMVPVASRSRLITLTQKATRTKRALSEYLFTCPQEMFLEVWLGNRNCIGSSLIACYQREETHNQNLPSHIKLTMPQAPKNALIFWDQEAKVKRDRNWLINEIKTWKPTPGVDATLRTIFLDRMEDLEKEWLNSVPRIEPLHLTWVPSAWQNETRNYEVADKTYLTEIMANSLRDNLPTLFGGSAQSHPLNYLINVETLRGRLEKMLISRARFKVSCLSSDQIDNIWLMMLRSNFTQNTRLSWKQTYLWDTVDESDLFLRRAELNLKRMKFSPDGILFNFMEPEGHYTVSQVDLTPLVNHMARIRITDKTREFMAMVYELLEGKITLLFSSSEYKPRTDFSIENYHYKLWERNDKENHWTHVIVHCKHTKIYSHSVVLQETSSNRTVDTDKDKYNYKEPRFKIKVRFRVIGGMLLLEGLNGFVFTFFGQTLSHDLHTYRLTTSSEDLYLEEIEQLVKGSSMPSSFVEELTKDDVDLGSNAQLEEKEGELNDDAITLLFRAGTDQDSSGSEFDEDYLDNLEDSDPDEGSDIDSDVQSSSVFSVGSTWKSKSKAITTKNYWAVESLKRLSRPSRGRLPTYAIRLPFDIEPKEYANSENGTALEKMVENIKQLDPDYSDWCMRMLSLALKSSAQSRYIYE